MRVRGFLRADSHTLNETHRFLRNLIEPAVDQQWSTAGALLARYDALDLDSGTSSRTWPEIIPSPVPCALYPRGSGTPCPPLFLPSRRFENACATGVLLEKASRPRFTFSFYLSFFPSGCQAMANPVTATTFVTLYFCRPKRGKCYVFLSIWKIIRFKIDCSGEFQLRKNIIKENACMSNKMTF